MPRRRWAIAGLLVALEDALLVGGLDADAVVGHGQDDGRAVGRRPRRPPTWVYLMALSTRFSTMRRSFSSRPWKGHVGAVLP